MLELETLNELGRNGSARIYIDFDKDMPWNGAKETDVESGCIGSRLRLGPLPSDGKGRIVVRFFAICAFSCG